MPHCAYFTHIRGGGGCGQKNEGEKRLKPYARVKVVREACEYCLSGNWQQLVDLQQRRKAAIKADDLVPTIPGLIDDKNARSILKAAAVGNATSCWRRTYSYGVARCNSSVSTQLRHKWGCDRPEPLPQLVPDSFRNLLWQLSWIPLVLEGPSTNWRRAKHMMFMDGPRKLFELCSRDHPDSREATLSFLRPCIAGTLHARTMTAINTVHMVPLYKNAKSDVRPIAIGTLWRKMWSLVTLPKYPLKQDHELLAHQYALGSFEGYIQFAQAVRLNTSGEGMASLQCDISDAFSSIQRQAVVEALVEYDPHMCRDMQGWLCQPTQAKVKDPAGHFVTMSTSSGIPQGDSMSTLAFSLTMGKALRATAIQWKASHPHVPAYLDAYVDDVVITTREELLHELLRMLCQHLREIGLDINPAKNVIWTHHGGGHLDPTLGQLMNQQPSCDGLTLCGQPVWINDEGEPSSQTIPVGSLSYVQRFLRQKLNALQTKLRALTALHPAVDAEAPGKHVAYTIVQPESHGHA